MSMMTSADLAGSIAIGDVVVEIVRRSLIWGLDGVGGCVRSKPVLEECSQKFEGEPIVAFLCGVDVSSRTRWDGIVVVFGRLYIDI